MESWSRYVP